MKIVLIVVLFVFAANVEAQTQPQGKSDKKNAVPYDTIIRFGNRKIPVVKLTLGATTVTYALPHKPDSIIRLGKKEIEKIIYKNGNVDVLNKAVVEVIKDDQWQAVLLTRDEKDVQGLYDRGEVRARSTASAKNKKKAIEGATIKIQKQAAGKKATIILITNDAFDGGYGDVPGYVVEGIAYGPEPLETGTNVVDPKNKNKKDNKKDSKSKSGK